MSLNQLQCYFPKDIAKIIEQMKNHSEHFDSFKTTFDELPKQSIVLQFQYLYHLDNHPLALNEQEMARKYSYSLEYIKDAIEVLSQCTCCEHHQHDKPKSIKADVRLYRKYFTPATTQISCNKKEKKCKCKCPCRSVSRCILRHFIMTETDHDDLHRHMLYYNLDKVNKEIKNVTNSILKLQRELRFHASIELYEKLLLLKEEELEIMQSIDEHIFLFPSVEHELDEQFLVDVLNVTPNENTPQNTPQNTPTQLQTRLPTYIPMETYTSI
jgi:hypothetical protein